MVKALGLEEATFIQTWLHEMTNPHLSIPDLIRTPGKDLIPIESITDCYDLYGLLVKPGAPNVSNKSLVLHLAYIREQKDEGRVRAWVWCDTKDMLANCLTKLEKDGSLPSADLAKAMHDLWWNPSHVFEYQGQKAVSYFDFNLLD